MLTTWALWATLAVTPGLADELTVSDVRPTYGLLGGTRPDSKLLPGDSFVLAFTIDGLKADDDGKVLYEIITEIADASGKVHFKQSPRDLEAVNALGGSVLPAYAQVNIGLKQKPGEYTLKVTVKDRAGKKSKTITHPLEVLDPGFGLVHLAITGDEAGEVPAPILVPGQSVWVHSTAVGFERNKASSQPNLQFQLKVLDENGKATTAKPISGSVVKDVPANATGVPTQFILALNRAGKFTVELSATDKASGKTVTHSLPLRVLEHK